MLLPPRNPNKYIKSIDDNDSELVEILEDGMNVDSDEDDDKEEPEKEEKPEEDDEAELGL